MIIMMMIFLLMGKMGMIIEEEEILGEEMSYFLRYRMEGIEIVTGIIRLLILMILFKGKGRK